MDESTPSIFSVQQEFVRTNGLQLPLHPAQIISWIALIFEISSIFLVLLPPLSIPLKIISGVLISFFIILTCYYAYKACIINPTDPKVFQAEEARAKGQPVRANTKLYCAICRAYVLSRTKHCGTCNRCVDVFDHHCIWLNNCIGKSNYGYFVKTTVALFITTMLQFGFGVVILVNYRLSPDKFNRNSQEYYNAQGSFDALNYIMIACCIVNGLLFISLGKLIILHIWLHKKGLTTYESIVMKRMKQRNSNGQTEASPPRRSRVIKNLEEEGSTVTLNKSKLRHGSTAQTENEIRFDTHLHDQTIGSKIDNSPTLKQAQIEAGSDTARFDTTPFIQKASPKGKQVSTSEMRLEKLKSIHNDMRSSSMRQERQEHNSFGISMTKETKHNETFFEEEKQESQKRIKIDVGSEESPYLDSDNRKFMTSISDTNSSASLIKGWSGKLFKKTSKQSRVFAADSRTQSPSPVLTPGSKSQASSISRGLEDQSERASPFQLKVYQKINAFNLSELRSKLEQEPDALNLKSPHFGETETKNIVSDNMRIEEDSMFPQAAQTDIRSDPSPSFKELGLQVHSIKPRNYQEE